MGVIKTVVFADLFGSTNAFESLGNAKAAQAVTQATSWIAGVVEAHGGQVIKTLGDGVLALFGDNRAAIAAVVEMQRTNQKRLNHAPTASLMPIRIGVASGEVEMVAGDCYGDAVNVAARLSDLSGPDQIWANHVALDGVPQSERVRFRELGPISIRGRAEPCEVFQVDWQEDVATEFLTMQADLGPIPDGVLTDVLGGQVELKWGDSCKVFKSFDLPIHIGRVNQAEFMVNDPRVSRTHARLEWRNGSMFLVDLSSYGCWIRFADSNSDLLLRREECVLHGRGELALGTSFADKSAAVVSFSVS
jgi:class 3 adenylate cyclase